MASRSRVLACLALLTLLASIAMFTALSWRRDDAAATARAGAATQVRQVSDRSESRAENAAADAQRTAVAAAPKDRVADEHGPPTTIAPLLRIRVVAEESAQPIAGVPVLVITADRKAGMPAITTKKPRGRMEPEDEVSTMPTTGEDGWAEVEVLPGRALVAEVWPSEFAPASHEVEAMKAGELVEIVLAVTTTNDIVFHGRLVADDDGRPIAGGVIEVEHRSTDVMGGSLGKESVRSNDAGLFQLVGATWRRGFAQVSAPGFGPMTFRIARGHGTPDQALPIRMLRGATLEATVLDERRAPIEGAQVVVAAEPYAISFITGLADFVGGGSLRHEGTTDAEGRCRIVELPPGVQLAVEARAPGRQARAQSDRLALEPGEARSIELAFGGDARVSGVVVDGAGAPVANHKVWRLRANPPVRHLFATTDRWDRVASEKWSFAATTTDESGRFEWLDFAPGAWWIGPAPISGEPGGNDDREKLELQVAPLAEHVQLAAGQSIDHLVVRAERGLFLAGRVVDEAGAGIEHAQILAMPSFPLDAWVSGSSDAKGAFRIGPLPSGEWELLCFDRERRLVGPKALRASSGRTNLLVKLKRGGQVRGRVLGLPARATDDVRVFVTLRDESSTSTHAFVKDDGRYESDGLHAGTVDVTVRTRQGQFGSRTGIVVRAGEVVDDVDIELSPGAKLRVRVHEGDERTLARFFAGDVEVGWVSFGAGHAPIAIVPPGAVRVELLRPPTPGSKPEPVASRTVSVAAGKEALVDFTKVE